MKCVRWDQNGERLASAWSDKTVKVLDFASGKVTYTGKTVDESKTFIIYVLYLLFIIRFCHVNMFSVKKAVKTVITMMKI